MGKVKILGDHSQTLFEVVRNGTLNIVLAVVLPFVAVFTSVVGVKNGVKTRQPLRYILHGFAFIVALVSMVMIPAGLHYLTDKESKFVAATDPNVYIQLSTEYVAKPLPSVESGLSNVGKVEGVSNVSVGEVSALISKNIDLAKTFYKDKDFKVAVNKSDGSVKTVYLFKKSSPEVFVSHDLISGSANVAEVKSLDLFAENVFKEPVYEKGNITTTVNVSDKNINDVLLAVQGKSTVYGVMYSTDAKVDYAMQRLNRIIVNSLDSVITTYEFVDLTSDDVKLFESTVAKANADAEAKTQ